MQWVGGLGIVVLSIAAMIQPGLVAKRLDIAEDYENDLIGSTRAHARRVFAIYAILTVAGVLMLIGSGSEWFESPKLQLFLFLWPGASRWFYITAPIDTG